MNIQRIEMIEYFSIYAYLEKQKKNKNRDRGDNYRG